MPGPLTGSITGFGLPNPSATAPSVVSSATGSASPAATSASSANEVRTSGIVAFMAAILGLALA